MEGAKSSSKPGDWTPNYGQSLTSPLSHFVTVHALQDHSDPTSICVRVGLGENDLNKQELWGSQTMSLVNVTNIPADVKVIFVLVSFPVSGFHVFPVLQPMFENPL